MDIKTKPTLASVINARSLALIEAFEEDENKIRDLTLIISGDDQQRHEIPLHCSLKQARKIKLAVFEAGADALAVPR